jgi:hypothetical protein
VQGQISTQTQQVGNAVPYPMAWAMLGAVWLAAYGVPAPLPSFLEARALELAAAGAVMLSPACVPSGAAVACMPRQKTSTLSLLVAGHAAAAPEGKAPAAGGEAAAGGGGGCGGGGEGSAGGPQLPGPGPHTPDKLEHVHELLSDSDDDSDNSMG